jgi:hypothetical protein
MSPKSKHACYDAGCCLDCDWNPQNHPDAMPHNFCKYCRHNYECFFKEYEKYGTETATKDA